MTEQLRLAIYCVCFMLMSGCFVDTLRKNESRRVLPLFTALWCGSVAGIALSMIIATSIELVKGG